MTEQVAGSVRPFYADWAGYNRRTKDGLARLSDEELALRVPTSEHWPVWAIAGHMAGTRVYWLCDIFGEPGADTTPFQDASFGWEDDLTHPRSGAELADAFALTWAIVEGCLERWTPSMLSERFFRQGDAGRQGHTRESVLLRMISHEAYHVGEINLALGTSGREMIDLWPSADWLLEAPPSLREG